MTKEQLIELSIKMGINVIAMGEVHMFSGNSTSFLNFAQEIRKKLLRKLLLH
jgi:hypothetical protein